MATKFKIDKGFLTDALEEYMLELLNEIRHDLNRANLPHPPMICPPKNEESEITLTEVCHEVCEGQSYLAWVPSSGTWFVAGNGEVRKMDPNKTPQWWKNDMEIALGAGRLYATEEKAKMAARLQRKFMRFVKWVSETFPEADYDNFLIANSFFADKNRALEVERIVSEE
jgi:hypothetical protein